MHKHLHSLILVACAGIGAAQKPPTQGSTAEQQPGVTFRTEINFVEVHAIVTDDNGAFVKDLTKDDFEIYEAGKLQKPAVFSLIDVPIERPLTPANASEPVEWDVRTTTRAFDGRIYVLALDDLHTAPTRSQLVRDAARGFVEHYLGANDLAAVVHTSGRQEAGQELTGSRRLLLAAIDRFQGQKLPSAGAEKLAAHLREAYFAEDDAPGGRTIEGLQRAEAIRDPSDAERGLNARRTLASVQKVANWLADVQGRRKALLLFSEGLDYDIYEPFNRGVGDSLLLDAQQAVGRGATRQRHCVRDRSTWVERIRRAHRHQRTVRLSAAGVRDVQRVPARAAFVAGEPDLPCRSDRRSGDRQLGRRRRRARADRAR